MIWVLQLGFYNDKKTWLSKPYYCLGQVEICVLIQNTDSNPIFLVRKFILSHLYMC